MHKLVAFVEGQGDEKALGTLIRMVLAYHSRHSRWTFETKRARGAGAYITREERITECIKIGRSARAAAILLLADADGNCVIEHLKTARSVTQRQKDVGIVLAKYEYENWILAGHASWRDEDDDLISNPKSEISKIWDISYKPAARQKEFTSTINVELAQKRSRSFRAFCNCIERICP